MVIYADILPRFPPTLEKEGNPVSLNSVATIACLLNASGTSHAVHTVPLHDTVKGVIGMGFLPKI